jgi:hypothetical protein
MIWLFSYLLVFTSVLFGIASVAKHEFGSKNSGGKREAKFFLFLKNERKAYLVLLILSLIFSSILYYFFPDETF